MSDRMNVLEGLPDISFIDGLTLQDMQGLLLGSFTEKYMEDTGKQVALSKADPYRIILLSCAQILYQGLQQIEKAGKMNFLKYAYDSYLENMAALKKITRLPARKAAVPVLFTLSAPREGATGIPAGTRVTASYEAYFATVEYAEIPAGETEISVLAECTEAGTGGNGYAAGELNILVDPVGFIAAVRNTESSTGGTDVESDSNLAERVFLAPSSYSTAGPDDAYEYWVKACSPDIGDVKVTSPSPGVVDIRFLMSNGDLPDDAAVAAVQDFVSQRGKRPLTDHVQVFKPAVEEYAVDLTYYINTSTAASAAALQRKIEQAVAEYELWQASRVGRDINPDELTARAVAAGAKRVEIREPVFRVVGETAKAVCISSKIVYGGLEND